MNRVLPLSDIVSPLAGKERFERSFRFRRTQALAENLPFLIEAGHELLGRTAHQRACRSDRPGRQRRDLARGPERLGVDVLRIDHQVDEAERPWHGLH